MNFGLVFMLNWIVEKNDLSSKEYIVSGMRSFLNRFADAGFKTKWCGIWAPPLKLFDYFAFKINGDWLSSINTSKCVVKPWGAKHYFDLMDIEATEIVFAPDEFPVLVSVLSLKNKTASRKKIVLELEAAVNIRAKHENVHDRKYGVSFNDLRKAVCVESDTGKVMFGGARKTDNGVDIAIENKVSNYYKVHYPGSTQSCFVPSVYSMSFDLDASAEVKIPFVFCGSGKNDRDLLDIYDICMRNYDKLLDSRVKYAQVHNNREIGTPLEGLDRTFVWAQYSLLGLLNRSKVGLSVFAGYPWFLEFWGRDVFISILGLNDMGEFAYAREILVTMAKFQSKRMPCIVHTDGRTEYHGADVDPMFIIALLDYEKKSADASLRIELKDNIDTALKNLELMDYVVTHGPHETWMDSTDRKGSAVEIQAMWAEALKVHEPKIAMKMKNRLNQHFWNGDKQFYYDSYSRLPDPEVTANGLLPLFFGLAPSDMAKHVLDRTKNELFSTYGIRTRSKLSPNYNPAGYHTGSVWGLTTGFGAVSFLRYGMVGDGLRCLECFVSDCGKYQPGALSEVVDAESGALLGAADQAWSSALYLYAIDDYLFGIKPDMVNGVIYIEPRIPEGWEHMQRTEKIVGNHAFDLKINKTHECVEVTIDFRRKPSKISCELVFPEEVKSIFYKGKKAVESGNKIKFTLDKTNVIKGIF